MGEMEPGIFLRIDPLENRLAARAAQLARRDGSTEIRVRHLFQALTFRPMTPALEEHLLKAAAIADDEGSNTISDIHALLAILESDCLATGVVAAVGTLEPILAELRMTLRDLPRTGT
jgi:hypothetical protein